jgi:hypothetical protein
MSPEQARGDALDHRTDLFSLGSVLYAMCSGHPPFRAENTMAVLKRVCDDEPRRLRDSNPDIPEWLEAIISRLQRKAPADRFATAREVADSLSRRLVQLQSGAESPGTTSRTELAGPTGSAPRNLRRWVAAALAVALVTAGAAWVISKNWPGGSPPANGDGPSGQLSPAGAAPNRVPPSLLLRGSGRIDDEGHRVELANTAGMIDLNGAFTVEMWVKFGKEKYQYFAGDDTWPAINAAVKRTYGWVLRIHPDQRLNFTAAIEIDDRPLEWAEERGDVIGFDDDWHHLAVSSGREGINVFRDGRPYLHMKKNANIKFMNSPTNIFLGPTNSDFGRHVNCHFKAFRVSGKPLYSQPFTPPVEFTKTDDTLLLLDFSVGKGATLPDLSGHGHHGTISGGKWSSSEPADVGNPGVQPSPAGAPQDRGPPSLLLNGLDRRVELANTAGMIDLNGEFTVEMWVKFGKGVQYFAGDEAWPDVDKDVKRAAGWVLRIREDRMNFTAAAFPDRPKQEWAEERGAVIAADDNWHHLAVSKSREVVNVFLDGKPYLSMKTENIRFENSPSKLFLGSTNPQPSRRVNCHFKAFRVSGKPLYSQTFTPPAEFTKTDDTLLLLDFSAGKGETLPDLSGHAHHGTIRGGTWSSSEPAKK